MPGRRKPVGQQDLKTRGAYEKALQTFGGRPDVSGIDIGYRYDETGRRVGEPTVRIHYVEPPREPRRTMAKATARTMAAAPAGTSPTLIDGVELFALSATYARHRAPTSAPAARAAPPPRQRKANPLRPGVSVSHRRTSGGTLGLVVYDLATGDRCIVSNHHVLVPDGATRRDNIVVQPAASVHEIGTVIRRLLGLDGDAAIARLNGSRRINPAQVQSDVVIRDVAEPQIGDVVEKSGLRTGVTRGVVDGIGRYYVSPANPEGMNGFRIVCPPTSDGTPCQQELSGMGDSGAVWYRVGDAKGVGLHVGGDPTGGASAHVAIACHLTRVIRRLRVSILPR